MTKKQQLKIIKMIKREGNHYEFTYRGMQCGMKRNSFGSWNGYVEFQIDYSIETMLKLNNNIMISDIIDKVYCHGGITYSKRKGDIIKIGFDCNHFNDFCPCYLDLKNDKVFNAMMSNKIYRNRHYVYINCKSIVFQLEQLLCIK